MLPDYRITSLIVAIISIFLGLFVFSKNWKSTSNRTWLALSCCVSVWSFGIYALHSSSNETGAIFWVHFMYGGAIFVPSFFLHLIFSLIKKKISTHDIKILLIFYSISTFFLIFNLFSSLFVKGVKPILGFKYFTNPGILFPFYGIYFLGTAAYALLKIKKAYSNVSGVKRNQLNYIFISTIAGFGGALSTMLPLLNISTPRFGYYLILSYTLIVSYAIVKHQLMDISIVIKKGAVYAYLSFLVFIPCMLLIIFAQKYYFGQTNTLFSLLAFCTFLLASLAILKVKPAIEDYIEKRLFKKKFEYKKTVKELTEIIISFLDEKELLKKATDIFLKNLGTKNVSFFIKDKEKRAYTLRASRNLKKFKVKELPLDDLFFHWLEEKGKATVREETEKIVNDPQIKSVLTTMESMESEVCIPLMARDQLIGIINLGHKRSGEMYSNEDLDLLNDFAAQTSIALENARLYQEMQRTQQLMRRTDRLASLGSLTAGLAHEIRNPLVTIKTFLDLVPERYKDKEFRGNFLKLTTSELDRITKLVSDLLDFARPKKPTLKRTDVNHVIAETIVLIQVEAIKRDINIEMNLRETPRPRLDADQMKQVFLNILLNAIEAIKAHGKISVTTRAVHKNGTEYVEVEIEDNGKGIPKKVVERIFDPFFTTKVTGAGLGLAISHQIVEEHNGIIMVESKPKKGTTFFVNIPVKAKAKAHSTSPPSASSRL